MVMVNYSVFHFVYMMILLFVYRGKRKIFHFHEKVFPKHKNLHKIDRKEVENNQHPLLLTQLKDIFFSLLSYCWLLGT